MRHVVIDTNCLLQMISRHNPYYRAWSAFDNGQYYICVSNDIINEYREIIAKLTNALVADNVIATIIRSPYCLRYDPHFHFGLIRQDPDENKFVDCAIIANADYVVSEDSHFNEFKDIPFPQVNVLKSMNLWQTLTVKKLRLLHKGNSHNYISCTAKSVRFQKGKH